MYLIDFFCIFKASFSNITIFLLRHTVRTHFEGNLLCKIVNIDVSQQCVYTTTL